MKSVSVVICNYNKKEYALKCVNSVLESSFSDLDIYVVDNASIDDSARAIRDKFDNKVNLIENRENLGGSGGFNTGIRESLKKDYKYVLLLDNDVVLDKYAIENLYNYLEGNTDAAVAGSKIYSMDNPSQIQEMGAEIDFNNFYIKPFYKGHTDDENLPKVVECDYVPACSMMIRVDAIKKVGIMDKENFIYWDDIDWGYRFKKSKYKVVTYSKSIVWHKMGVAQRTNTFGTYYFWRNRVHFFAKYINENEIEAFAFKIFNEVFQAMYSCNYIGKYSSARTIITAVDDALNNVRGKASDSRILKLEEVKDRFGTFIKDKKHILILNNSNVNVLRSIINKIKSLNDKAILKICSYDNQEIKEQFSQYESLEFSDVNLKQYETIIEVCDHIFDVRDNIKDNVIYVDRFFNTIISENDRKYVSNYENSYNLLKNIWYPVLVDKIRELRSKF